MGKWISDGGLMFPANERVGLTNNTGKTLTNPSMEGSMFYEEQVADGQDYIYEGPDRDSMKYLKDQGFLEQGYMGTHFMNSNDMFELARAKGYDNVEDYIKKTTAWDEDKSKEVIEKRKKEFFTRKAPERVKAVNLKGGGDNTAPGGSGGISGGIGDPTGTVPPMA